MRLNELLNHRVSYQVLVTFDLIGAESSKYEPLRNTLAEELELEKVIHLSKDDGGTTADLPYNTLAALWEKDSTAQEVRDHFEDRLKKAFDQHRIKGRYVIFVGQNWAVAANQL
ncbi:hypothetical protein LG331_02915 [Vreelandella aquamarina]|uniref:hypothetical protein n=1 Tax=Vreelandella aquamarina TaxID=77097 RepID=UPI00384EC44F